MSDFRSKPKMSISEIQPDYQSGDMPRTLHQTRRHQEVLYVAGEGPRDSGVMFVAPALEEDEARELQQSTYGIQIRQPARYLKGDIGSVLRDSALSVGLDLDKHYYTAFIKWLLPRTQRNKPPKEAQEWATPAFEAEVRECKPKYIVCLGKLAFDQLVKVKISASDALGGWFWSDWAQARVMLMDKPYTLLQKPERLEQYRLLFRDVQRMVTDGEDVEKVPLDYREIRSMEQLQALVKEWEDGDFKLFGQDNEWEGNNHLDGRLRSSQFCWAPGVAACLTFFDETGELHLGAVQHLGNSMITIQPGNREVAPGEWYTDYRLVGQVLGRWLNRPDVRYVGHYIQADLPWLKVWLELEVYRKCVFDTAFAMNVLDEYSPVGLEWVALLFTDLGRYDLPLLLWKKANPQKDDAGYGKIPGEILVLYSCSDVDAPFRAAPKIMARLKMDGVWDYYQKILHPFVSDVFTAFCLHGLPMDLEAMDDMREVYHFAHGQFLEEFRAKITQQAKVKLMQRCQVLLGFLPGLKLFSSLVADPHEALTKLLEHPDLADDQQQILLPFIKHLQGAPAFNPWSKPQMVRWLFEVLGLVPIKSTDQKEKGIRSMSWEKVLALPKDKQVEYKPATDQQTLQMLLDKEPLIDELIDLTATASICKAFLKEPTVDEETGEVTREQGLHYYRCSDGCIRCNYGLTESSRPRANRPNVLNWPSYVNGRIIEAMGRMFRKLHAEGRLPPQFERYLPAEGSDEAPIKSVRSLLAALPGWCLTESDYRTAELRSLALQSGDSNMMKMMTESDKSFGLAKVGGKTMPVRLYYDPPHVNGIEKIDQVPEVLMSAWKDGRKLQDVLPDQLLADEDGELAHPDHDLHWSLAEMVFCRPRELLVNKIHRRASKTANFSIVYDISSSTLERRIEVDTGKKPEPGTGQSLRDAWAKRYPRASDFLVELENIPREKGTYVAASGRKRRFHRHPVMLSQDSWRMTKSMFSAMGREMRNFPPQESVSSTALRAAVWLQEFGRANNLEGYQIAVLYDSIVTHCPLRERHIWAAAHELYMFRANSWTYDGRVLKYPVDTEFNVGWSDRPAKDVQALWDSFEYEPVPPRLLPVLGWLRGQLLKHTL